MTSHHIWIQTASVLMSTKWLLIWFHAVWKIVAKCHNRQTAKWPQEEECASSNESVLMWKERHEGSWRGAAIGPVGAGGTRRVKVEVCCVQIHSLAPSWLGLWVGKRQAYLLCSPPGDLPLQFKVVEGEEKACVGITLVRGEATFWLSPNFLSVVFQAKSKTSLSPPSS